MSMGIVELAVLLLLLLLFMAGRMEFLGEGRMVKKHWWSKG
jgi:hypothetical protein